MAGLGHRRSNSCWQEMLVGQSALSAGQWIEDLEREVHELRQTHDIPRKTSANFYDVEGLTPGCHS